MKSSFILRYKFSFWLGTTSTLLVRKQMGVEKKSDFTQVQSILDTTSFAGSTWVFFGGGLPCA